MYQAYFGLRDLPYRNTPDPRYMVLLPQYEQAVAMIQYAAEEREVVALFGDIGVGKTTVVRTAIQQLDEQPVEAVALIYPRITPYQLLALIADAIGAPVHRSRHHLMNSIAHTLVDLHQQGRSVLVVIDEAHLIPGKPVFEEIRFLSNLQLDAANLLGIVLVAQPELERRLYRRVYASFRQRIGMVQRLQPLRADEIETYLRQRWETAGGTWPGPFQPDGIRRIAELSRGIPRVINQLAHLALLEAFARDRTRIDATLVDSVRDAILL